MVYEILDLIFSTLGTCMDWVRYIFYSTGMIGWYKFGIFVFLVGRFFLSPIFGTAVGVVLGEMGSDRVNRRISKWDGGDPNQKRLNGR